MLTNTMATLPNATGNIQAQNQTPSSQPSRHHTSCTLIQSYQDRIYKKILGKFLSSAYVLPESILSLY